MIALASFMSFWVTRAWLTAALVCGGLVVPAGFAWAEREDARKHYDRATAAFGLGRYADAAVEYESAFRLRPDPALLYNCAQSYRLAGNKSRAVELYRNYLRLYGEASNADDARKHLSNLELEVAAERAVTARSSSPPPQSSASAVVPPSAVASSSPVPRAPVAASPLPAAIQPMPAAQSPTAIVAPAPGLMTVPALDAHVDLKAQPASESPADREQRSLVSRPWFWIAVGAVVVGSIVAIVAVSGGDKDPNPTFGVIPGN